MIPEYDFDPMAFKEACWPDVYFYAKQVEIIYAIAAGTPDVFVASSNMGGKDFIAGFIVPWFFHTFPHSEGAWDMRGGVRIIITSIKDEHTDVLWGEIKRFINTSKIPLPFRVLDREIKKLKPDGSECEISYVKRQVWNAEEAGAGHHAPATLLVGDEGSGLPDKIHDHGRTWAKVRLWIGNTNPNDNFYRKAFEGQPGTDDVGGNLINPRGGYDRLVFRIKAEETPNVEYGILADKAGLPPKQIVPGVLPYEEYLLRRRTWDPLRQMIGLDAEFPKGLEHRLFPEDWLNLSAEYANKLGMHGRRPKSLGIDVGEGGAESVWALIDDKGLIEMVAKLTPNTTDIVRETIRLIKLYDIPADNVWMDRGGGGHQHADNLRELGYKINTVGFGETVKDERQRALKTFDQRVKADEHKGSYASRRVEMYWLLRRLLTPVETTIVDGNGKHVYESRFAIPGEHRELRRQLLPFPLMTDGEGRAVLPKKQRVKADSKEITLIDLIGCSPDQADALVLACYGLMRKPPRSVAGAV